MEKPFMLSVEIPKGTEAKFADTMLTVKGKMGEVSRRIDHPSLRVAVKDGEIQVSVNKRRKNPMKLAYTYRAHIRNIVRGVNEGHEYLLKICASHFPMNVSIQKSQFIVKNFLGEKYPRTLTIKEGVEVKIEGDIIRVNSVDLEKAGMTASAIEELMKRPDFDPRIFQDGIYITSKDGKEIR